MKSYDVLMTTLTECGYRVRVQAPDEEAARQEALAHHPRWTPDFVIEVPGTRNETATAS